METHELFDHLNNIYNSYDRNWNFLIILVLAILAGILARKENIKMKISILIIIGLIGTAIFNGISLYNTVKEMKIVETEIQKKIYDEPELSTDFKIFYKDFSHFNEYWYLFPFFIILVTSGIVWIKTQKRVGRPISAENKAIVRRGYDEIWSKGSLDVVEELYAADFVLHDPAQPGVRGPEGYKQLVIGNRTAFPDLQITVEDQLAEADKVATRWTATGTQQGEMMGIPPTGKRGTVTGTTISCVVDSKIVEERSNWDTLGMLQQLGADPSIGEGGE